MKIASINANCQNFNGLNFNNVGSFDRENFVREGFKELKKLGEQYDIKLTSSYSDIPGYNAIDIDVRPLKDGLSFFKRLFRPTGRSSFMTESPVNEGVLKTKEEFLKSVNDAIEDLKNKVNLHK